MRMTLRQCLYIEKRKMRDDGGLEDWTGNSYIYIL